jgi:hypothetical protein
MRWHYGMQYLVAMATAVGEGFVPTDWFLANGCLANGLLAFTGGRGCRHQSLAQGIGDLPGDLYPLIWAQRCGALKADDFVIHLDHVAIADNFLDRLFCHDGAGFTDVLLFVADDFTLLGFLRMFATKDCPGHSASGTGAIIVRQFIANC